MTPVKRIGILQESQPYETRVPLTPEHIRGLCHQSEQDIKFIIQPSKSRCFTDEEFRYSGALVHPDLSAADIILGVKPMPLETLIPQKTYLFFAHVIKGQAENMNLLRSLLDRRITLIDYEKIADRQGKRKVFFGRSAGQAGMIETLRAFGQRLEAQGKQSILSQIRAISQYENLQEAKQHLQEIGTQIKANPQQLGITEYPVVCACVGFGNVGKGAVEILDLLPTIEIAPERLSDLFARENTQGFLVKTIFEKSDTMRDRNNNYDREDYKKNHANYRSILPQFLPYISILVNSVYWDSRYPKLISKHDLQQIWHEKKSPLAVVGDITCDVPDGSIACTFKATNLQSPIFGYHPDRDTICKAFSEEGITVMAVDNLPAGIPKDASTAFSAMLKEFIPSLVKANFNKEDLSEELPSELLQAVITHHGQLQPQYRYLAEYLKKQK